MTCYVWDMSSYNKLISATTAKRARAEGISGVTHRITRQTGEIDDMATQNLKNLLYAGFDLIGGYNVVYTSGGLGQVDTYLHQADQAAPWWRDHPGWFWQIDLETWPHDRVSATLGIAVAKRLRAMSGKPVALYASHGEYGEQLGGWDGPLWNANYPSMREAPFRDLYPGDNGPGWTPYSSKTPILWQYASSATIAGLTSCDISAYRGTLTQLTQALGTHGTDTMSLSAQDITDLTENIMNRTINGVRIADILGRLDGYLRSEPAQLTAIAQAVGTLQSPAGTINPATIATAVVEEEVRRLQS